MTSIHEYREKVIQEVYKFAETANVESFEINDAIEKEKKTNANFREFAKGKNTWRDFIHDSEDVLAIDNAKEACFKVINILSRDKREKELDKTKKDTDWYKEQSDYWQKSSEWWRKYNDKELDWQKDQKKRDAENKKQLDKPKEDGDEKNKKEFISDIEMELTKENISDERLSKRIGVSDWREKIRGAADFSGALSMRSHLWDIIRKLKYEYTCANCGVKKEEFTVHEKGDKKYCSRECKENGEDKNEKDDRKPTKPKTKSKFGVSDINQFFAWMKKMGVTELKFDSSTNQIVIKCGNSKQLSLADSGLSTKQQEELAQQLKSTGESITYSDVSKELGKEKDNKGNGGIIAAIVVVGIIFAAIIGVVIYKSRKKDY